MELKELMIEGGHEGVVSAAPVSAEGQQRPALTPPTPTSTPTSTPTQLVNTASVSVESRGEPGSQGKTGNGCPLLCFQKS